MNYKKDENGEFILDEQGNKIPEDINKDDEINEIVKQKLDPIVEELKTVRQGRDLANQLLKEKEAEIEKLKNGGVITDDEKVSQTVEKILKDKELANAKANKKAAFEKYCTEHKEFHPDNDIGGIKRAGLLAKFNMFNTEDITGLDDFYSVVGDAHKLLGGNDKNQNTSKDIKNPYSSTPTPKDDGGKTEPELSEQEEKLIQQSNWTKDKFLALKKKDPDYVRSLLYYVH